MDSNSLGSHDHFQVNIKTVAALILTCLCALLANAAGIGGGPIYLPLLMVRAQLSDTSEAVNASFPCCSLMQLAATNFNSHPLSGNLDEQLTFSAAPRGRCLE